eukprot:CAMPEP_0202917574 /NCGR_PEP_ID=MMETSP1392-20130828/71313_1 /ASSEMBLY_ACC=CAM_ASM_000868 /TAXON_ID=225041 /ORGANISM="Chlamydomonas chlamydogama, Strain SAG 11-48b" /LENGTH=254 /DNA_ID=CAMNT_0049610361 /DNA_START=66 /DNA_END=827 /DNA_ORIENTATION=-
MGEEWDCALYKEGAAYESLHDDLYALVSNPHRAHCSAAEASEWDRVLSARAASTNPDNEQHDIPLGHQAHEPPSSAGQTLHGAISPSSQSQPSQPSHPTKLLAVLECGSHSTRALICDSTGRELARLNYDTMLSDGLLPGGPLQPAAVTRVLQALHDIQEQLLNQHHGQHRQQQQQDQQQKQPQQDVGVSQQGAGCSSGQTDCSSHSLQAEQETVLAGEVEMRMIGTAALRMCSNPEVLTTAAQQMFGGRLEVL